MKAVIMVGLPASGKSSKSKDYTGFTRICADDIREQLYGDPGIQGDHAETFKVFFEQLTEATRRGCDLVVDNTNVRTRDRLKLVEFLQEKGYTDITYHLMKTPFEECKRRNLARDRKVPLEVMNRMKKSFDETLKVIYSEVLKYKLTIKVYYA